MPQGLVALEAGDGAALGALYASLPSADRVHFVDGLGQLCEIGALLPPRSGHPSLAAIEGGLRYVWAHRLRGFATADRTSDAQAFNMYEMADTAHAVLQEAAALTPQDSALHTYRIRTEMLARGVEGGIEAVFGALNAAGETNLCADLAKLSYLSPKWHGSVSEMHAFADAVAARPPNAAFLALKARAVIEEWLYETAMSDEDGAAEAFRKRTGTPAFRAALAALDDRFLDLAANGPALSAAEVHLARNQFGALFALFPDKARLKRHLAEIRAPAATPWGYLAGGDVSGLVARLRRETGLPKA